LPHEAGQVLLRALAEGLAPLGSVDAGQTDSDLALAVGEDGQGVAVGDVGDSALQHRAGPRRRDAVSEKVTGE